MHPARAAMLLYSTGNAKMMQLDCHHSPSQILSLASTCVLRKGYSECMFERSAPLLEQLPLSPWEMLYHIQPLQFRVIKNMKINMIL